MKKSVKIIIIVVIAALIIGGLIYFYNKKKKEKTGARTNNAPATPTRAEAKAETIKTRLATGAIKVAEKPVMVATSTL